jgi:hypothetical protein
MFGGLIGECPSERGVRRAPDLLPEDYMGSEQDSVSLDD